ncbi:MAG: LysM peptidoglycan-binding domain-containing protein [Neptuniibacter sp.]
MFSRNKSVLLSALSALLLSGCQNLAEKAEVSPTDISGQKAVFFEPPAKSLPAQVTATPDSDIARNDEVYDLWHITRDKMQLGLNTENPRVKQQLNWYKKHPEYMQRVITRAQPYYYYILHEAIKRDIPAEMALLPIVESAFDPFAYSHGRAAGPWQFIPSTGKHFGLKQNWWYDGRRDILLSTEAAFTYLEQLNKRFDGDWLLALAAYNAGGGNVSRAIKRNKRANKPIDFWSLKLPKETMAYVPKLLAVSELIKNSQNYGLDLPEITNSPYFESINTESQIDLAQAAKMAGITTKEMYLLNPGYNRWATDPDGPHRLLIPVEKAEQFKSALAELPKDKRLNWTRYKIKSGDSLISIANKFDTTVEHIKRTNQIKTHRIRAGQSIMISTATGNASEYVLSQQQRHAQKQKTIARTTDRQENYYTVKSGDSFWTIAKKYQVGVRQLARWNSMAPGDSLNVGKRLVIWSKPQQISLSSTERQIIRKIGYRVRSGDSLYRIAGKFNVQVADILRWNKIDKHRYLKPGQRLTLFVDVTQIN